MHRSRYKGKFCKKNVIDWKKNVIKSNQSRKEDKENSNFIELAGRRLVDIKILSNDLWCHSCDKALSLGNAVSESRNGLSSTFMVKCTTCNGIFQVNTSSTEKNTSTRPTYTVNSKIVNGVIESGIGNTHPNKILTAAEVPVMYSTAFKRHEKKVGAAIEVIANESCLENLMAEREMTIEREGYALRR